MAHTMIRRHSQRSISYRIKPREPVRQGFFLAASGNDLKSHQESLWTLENVLG